MDRNASLLCVVVSCLNGVMVTGDTQKPVLILDCAPFTGGAQRSLAELLPGLIVQGWSPHVLAADNTPNGLVQRCRERAIPVRELTTRHWQRTLGGGLCFVVDRARAGRALRQAVLECPPLIIHANGIRAGLLVPRTVSRAIPICLHDRDLRVPRWAVRLMGRRAQRVIAISACVGAKWKTTPAPVDTIPNGFDLEAIRRDAAARPVDPGEEGMPLLVLVADMVPWKRHAVFLDAVAEIRRTAPKVTAAVIGRARDDAGNRYLDTMRQRASAAGIADAVRFVTDATCAAAWIAAADVLVSVATEEPFGRTIVEALALGTPVVAVNACGPGEILADCPAATLTASGALDVANGIGLWLEPGKRHTAAASARAWAERYALDRSATALARTFDQLSGHAS